MARTLLMVLGLVIAVVGCDAGNPENTDARSSQADVEIAGSEAGDGEGQIVWNSDAAAEAATERRERIRAEIAAIGGDHWAGEYYCGDGLGENVSVSIAPTAGFVFENHGCLGLYNRNYGSVSATDGTISLSFELESKGRLPIGVARQLVPITWGARRYLVPADEMPGFCNKVNDTSEPRRGWHGTYLLRDGDRKREAAGLPNVPKQYRAYLLPEPIQAAITAIGQPTTRPSRIDCNFKDTPVTVNKGTAAGLLTGMNLHIIEPESGLISHIEITKADVDTSDGVIVQFGEHKPAPEIGWLFSTRPRWAGMEFPEPQ